MVKKIIALLVVLVGLYVYFMIEKMINDCTAKIQFELGTLQLQLVA